MLLMFSFVCGGHFFCIGRPRTYASINAQLVALPNAMVYVALTFISTKRAYESRAGARAHIFPKLT